MRWENIRYASLVAFTAATGQEPHGVNVEPGFTEPTNGNYTLDSQSGLVDAGVLIPGINDDYSGTAPDIGAFEFIPALSLRGIAGARTIYLNWAVNTTLPTDSTWRISYIGTPGDQPSPIKDILNPTRAYTLTGLTNYEWYTVTLNAMLDSTPILTDTISAMPTDHLIYLPIAQRGN